MSRGTTANRRSLPKQVVFFALGLLSACADALAQAPSTGSGWSGTLGAGPVFVSKYVGGKDLQALPLPIAYVSYNDWLVVNLYRASAYVWGSEDKKKGISFSLEPRLGFHSSDGAKLAGMATRRGSLSGGPTFDWQGDLGALSIGYFSDLSNASRGGYVDVLFNRPFINDSRWDVSGTIELSRLDSKVVNYYFGVTPSEVTPTRALYQPGATTNVTVWITGQHNLTKRYALMFGANVTLLGSAAADSPIVERRQAPFIYLGVGINL
jgi:outer membrane protein